MRHGSLIPQSTLVAVGIPMTRQFFCTLILAAVLVTASCGRRKTPVSLPVVGPQAETMFTQGSADFHLGTPEAYARAADSFRKARALRPNVCDYPLQLVQSLLF